MSDYNVGEVWLWRDPDIAELVGEDDGTEVFLVLRTEFCRNDAAVEMLSLERGEVTTNFPHYDKSKWTRIA